MMLIGVSNAHASFQAFINDVLRPYLNHFCSAYIDDILIYSNSLEKHKRHVRQILDLLLTNGLHLNSDKCEFYKTKMTYLDMIISKDGISMNLIKVAAIIS